MVDVIHKFCQLYRYIRWSSTKRKRRGLFNWAETINDSIPPDFSKIKGMLLLYLNFWKNLTTSKQSQRHSDNFWHKQRFLWFPKVVECTQTMTDENSCECYYITNVSHHTTTSWCPVPWTETPYLGLLLRTQTRHLLPFTRIFWMEIEFIFYVKDLYWTGHSSKSVWNCPVKCDWYFDLWVWDTHIWLQGILQMADLVKSTLYLDCMRWWRVRLVHHSCF